MAFTPGEHLEIPPKSLLFQEHNSIQSIPERELLDPMEKRAFVLGFQISKDMEGQRQIRAELLHPGTREVSVGRDFPRNLQPGRAKVYQKSTAPQKPAGAGNFGWIGTWFLILYTGKQEPQSFGISFTINNLQTFICQIQIIPWEPARSPGTGCTRMCQVLGPVLTSHL